MADQIFSSERITKVFNIFKKHKSQKTKVRGQFFNNSSDRDKEVIENVNKWGDKHPKIKTFFLGFMEGVQIKKKRENYKNGNQFDSSADFMAGGNQMTPKENAKKKCYADHGRRSKKCSQLNLCKKGCKLIRNTKQAHACTEKCKKDYKFKL